MAQASTASKPGGRELDQLLAERRVRVVDFAGWQRINAAEVARGMESGRPREKFTRIEELLLTAAAERAA